jgi:hypothetical protein
MVGGKAERDEEPESGDDNFHKVNDFFLVSSRSRGTKGRFSEKRKECRDLFRDFSSMPAQGKHRRTVRTGFFSVLYLAKAASTLLRLQRSLAVSARLMRGIKRGVNRFIVRAVRSFRIPSFRG